MAKIQQNFTFFLLIFDMKLPKCHNIEIIIADEPN